MNKKMIMLFFEDFYVVFLKIFLDILLHNKYNQFQLYRYKK